MINFIDTENIPGIHGTKLKSFPLSFYNGLKLGSLKYVPTREEKDDQPFYFEDENYCYDLSGKMPFSYEKY
jgi:hypothetical protein